jgi:hypothetical protein
MPYTPRRPGLAMAKGEKGEKEKREKVKKARIR